MIGISVKPEMEFKVGAIRAAIWTNPRQSKDGSIFHSHRVIVERTYKDMHGNFKSTHSLDTNDIPKAILALKKTYDYLMTKPKPAQQTPNHPENDYDLNPAQRVP